MSSQTSGKQQDAAQHTHFGFQIKGRLALQDLGRARFPFLALKRLVVRNHVSDPWKRKGNESKDPL